MIGIGSVVTAWSFLETANEIVLYILAQTPDTLGQALTDGLSADHRIKALKRLCDTWLVSLKEERVEAITAINETRKLVNWQERAKVKRNKIVHHIWHRMSDDEMLGRRFSTKPVQADKLYTERFIAMKTHELSKFAVEVTQKADAFFALLPVLEKLPAWPKRQPLPPLPQIHIPDPNHK
jgi:hypothetical protein